ncbi:MAG: hypothetical protein PHW02_00960 [bacterium]|nr:hypothetical protein [bacterium]
MINLFIPPVLLLIVGIGIALIGNYKERVAELALLISFVFASVVYILRLSIQSFEIPVLPVGEVFTAEDILFEYSTSTLILSFAVTLFSALFAVKMIAARDTDLIKYFLLSVISAFSLMSVQSLTIISFLLFSFLTMAAFVVFEYDVFENKGFGRVRLFIGIFISVIVVLISIALFDLNSLKNTPGSSFSLVGQEICFIILSFSLFLQIGGFPFNILSYDYMRELSGERRGWWVIFISLPAVFFIGKYIHLMNHASSSMNVLFTATAVSILIASLFVFVKKEISDISAVLTTLVSMESLLMIIYGSVKSEYIYLSSAFYFAVLGAFLLMSLGLLSEKRIEELRGSFRKNPAAAVSFLAVSFLISFIPPSLGFTIKYNMIQDLVIERRYLISSVLIIAFSIEVFVFLRILFSMFLLSDENEPHDSKLNSYKFILLISTLLIAVVFYFYQEKITEKFSSHYEEVSKIFLDAQFHKSQEGESVGKFKQFLIE